MQNPIKALFGALSSKPVEKRSDIDSAVKTFKREMDEFIATNRSEGEKITATSPRLIAAARALIENHPQDHSARCAFLTSFQKLDAGWFVNMTIELQNLPEEMDRANNGTTNYAASFFRPMPADTIRKPAIA